MSLLATNVIEIHGGHAANFKIGYHASPSMHRLHLHVISTDYDSPSLKTKVHWNSFTTPFFLLHERMPSPEATFYNPFISRSRFRCSRGSRIEWFHPETARGCIEGLPCDRIAMPSVSGSPKEYASIETTHKIPRLVKPN